jgi:PAS domain S-box-containing protein
MTRNHQSSWHQTCQHQDVFSANPPRLELVPERTVDLELCLDESSVQKELQLHTEYDNIPCIYLALDVSGRILSISKFGTDSLGYLPEELISKPIFSLFDLLEQQKLSDALKGVRTSDEISSWEFRLDCPGSKIVWVKVVARMLRGRENPQILMVLEDITAYKSEETEIESEQRFYTLADQTPVMLWLAESNGFYTFLNQYWLEFTGRSMEQEKGLGWLESVHPEDRIRCHQNLVYSLNAQTKFEIEYRLRRADGDYRWIRDAGTPRFTKDRFTGYVGCCIDVTERKLAEVALRETQRAAQAQLEEMESLNHLKDEFLSTVSHELRTPLTNMKMAIQMLGIALNQQDSSQSKASCYFQILNNECDREINLINNFLDLQRLDSNVKPLVLETIQVESWLLRVVNLFKARNRNSLQNLQLHLAPNLPTLVSDPFSLERILVELLTNACKFSPANAEIIVSVNQEGSNIRFQVTNFGVEIAANELPRIFDKFYRIPSNDPWKQGGTGLGLALVQKLTLALGGAIAVESGSNCTCFTVVLPILVEESGMRSAECIK